MARVAIIGKIIAYDLTMLSATIACFLRNSKSAGLATFYERENKDVNQHFTATQRNLARLMHVVGDAKGAPHDESR